VKLSKRLNSCLDYTKGFYKLADIGTDHAQLPIAAITKKHVSYALAIDNKKGPYEIAKKHVEISKLENKISVILGEGLLEIDDAVDVVVISGMGGSLIAEILLKADLKNIRRFILQPNNDSFFVRKALMEINYKIEDEQIISDKNKHYDLIIAKQGKEYYNNLQLTFGPINLLNKSTIFVDQLNREIIRLKKLLDTISSLQRITEINQEIALLKEALK